jgi:hypothetical protein
VTIFIALRLLKPHATYRTYSCAKLRNLPPRQAQSNGAQDVAVENFSELNRRQIYEEAVCNGLKHCPRIAVLVQARTGRIGLAKFLYNQRVPGVLSAQCRCSAGEETPRHMALYCTEEAERRQDLRTNSRVDYLSLIGTARGARKLAEWNSFRAVRLVFAS